MLTVVPGGNCGHECYLLCRCLAWSGTFSGQPASGSGAGTSVLIKIHAAWHLLHELVSARPNGSTDS